MTLGDKQKHFASLVPRLIDFLHEQGYECTFGDCFRDERVKYGHPTSMHRKRLAVDLNLFKDGVYLTSSHDHAPLGAFWTNLDPNCTWGGDKDGNHYSMYAHDYQMDF